MKKALLVSAVLIVLGGGAVTGWYWYTHLGPAKQATPASKSVTPKPTPRSYVDTILERMSLHDKIASLLIMNTPGTDPAELGKFADTYHLGGFIMMGNNMPESDTLLRAETVALRGSDLKLPRFVATDEEGGTVKRLLGDNFASAFTLKNLPATDTADAFKNRSAMVQSVGITLNFGIIADVTADSRSFIYDRVLGTTPASASDRVAAAVTASRGLTLTTLKHFPGHGETEADSHHTIPTTDISFSDWQQRDEPPFQAGIKAGADMVMVGHLQYSAVDPAPASLSKKWHDVLRNQLGFKGVIITDAMEMLQDSGVPAYQNNPIQDAVDALNAGNTLLLYVANPVSSPDVLINGIETAVNNGTLPHSLIDDNAKKALQLRLKSASIVHPAP